MYDEGAIYEDGYTYEDQGYEQGYDEASAYEDALGYEYAFEANSSHLALVEAKPNPAAQHPHTLTRGFEKFAFPKLVRFLRSQELTHKQKALLGAAELLATGESAVQCLAAGVCAAVTTLLHDPVRPLGPSRLSRAQESLALMFPPKLAHRTRWCGSVRRRRWR
jgi:hypothetical protein